VGDGAAKGEGDDEGGGGVPVSMKSADGLVKTMSADYTNYCVSS
jgi:hypothetical protein